MVLYTDIDLQSGILMNFAAEVIGREKMRPEAETRFMQIVSAHSGIINRICYSYARNPEDFDDLRQDVLITLWRGLDSFRGDSSVITWIYRVALNTCVSAARRNSSPKDVYPLTGIIEPTEEQDAESDRVIMLHEMIAALPPEERALILMWLDEMPYEEIAEVMGYPRNTVAVKLHRIREKLKTNFQKHCKS